VPPGFEPVQPELFAAAGGQPNCSADYNNDGGPDLFVGFNADFPNRLYRNDGGKFVEVGADLKLGDLPDTRAAGWGDFNADGNPDLYVGFSRRAATAKKLYRNDGHGKFADIAKDLGVDVKGETRQISWIDFDNDGRLDLFVAFREAPNMLFRNEGNRFIDVAKDMGVDDPHLRQSDRPPWPERPLVSAGLESGDRYTEERTDDAAFLTSGGKEYLPDGRPGVHSPFASQILIALRTYGRDSGLVTFQTCSSRSIRSD
jgi:hypothetical protein